MKLQLSCILLLVAACYSPSSHTDTQPNDAIELDFSKPVHIETTLATTYMVYSESYHISKPLEEPFGDHDVESLAGLVDENVVITESSLKVQGITPITVLMRPDRFYSFVFDEPRNPFRLIVERAQTVPDEFIRNAGEDVLISQRCSYQILPGNRIVLQPHPKPGTTASSR